MRAKDLAGSPLNRLYCHAVIPSASTSRERYSLTAVPEALTINMLPPWPIWMDS